MALVKTSKVGAVRAAGAPSEAASAKAKPRAASAGTGSQRDKIAERIAAATEELASGLTEAASAAEELRRSMEQIAAGAEEAAGSSQEQLAAIKRVASHLAGARSQAETSRRRTETVQLVLTEAAVQVTNSVRAIEANAERQRGSLAVIGELERRAGDIGEVTRTVSNLADQTNLLALNAAIEAARAGDHGRGFAVVAEEVRALAASSEKSAGDVQELTVRIQNDVREVTAAVKEAAETAIAEARAGVAVASTLDRTRAEMALIAEGSQETLTTSFEAERASVEAQRGAEQVASAAEEQAAAAGESQSAIQQQSQSLDQGQRAAQALAEVAEGLRTAASDGGAADEIGATAEELSATIQELSSAATEIMAAVDQINRGSQMQAGATQETSAALAQIEKSAKVAQANARRAGERVRSVTAALSEGRMAVERLIQGVADGLRKTRASVETVVRLETVGRRIEKIVDAIALITVQTTMLSVSGSVEAARSGDAGRGFALVSTDIRRLAREASESIERVKDTVTGMQDQIAALRRDLEKQIGVAEAEVQANQSIAGSLGQVDSEIELLAAANTAISEGADAILAAASETAAGARQIAAAAEEASSASRQAAIASGQQARGAEDLAAAIEEIASLAAELHAK